MALLSTQNIAMAGVIPSFAAAAGGGDTCRTGDHAFLVVKNGGGSSITVTVAATPDTTAYGAAIPDLTVTVANGAEKWIGPLKDNLFGDLTDGLVHVTYSAVTSVTVGTFAV